MYWFYWSWWKYLLSNPSDDIDRWTSFWCRARNHPAGVIWYNFNPYRLEPDMCCKNCGDDLG